MHSFNVYIDEAGDEGFDFSKRTAEWFIISAVITRQENDLETLKNIVKETRLKLRYNEKQELHFRKMKHEMRIPYLNLIATSRVRAVIVAIHKPSLREQEKFRQNNRLYFYVCRLLLERVSWFCRDSFVAGKHKGDGTIKLIFSKRKNMSYENFRDYIRHLCFSKNTSDVRIVWNCVKTEQISALAASQSMGLQVADALASSAYQSLNKSDYGYVEDRYMRILYPILYRYGKNIWGYGFKIFPENETINKDNDLFKWIAETKNRP